MYTILFISFYSAYFFVSNKVNHWIIISELGHWSSTPLLFNKNPSIYSLVCLLLWSAALFSLIKMDSVIWWVALAAMIATFSLSKFIGKRKAFSTYREILTSIGEEPKTNKEIEQELDKQKEMNAILGKYR